jgi:outer membrane protein OmpA-like peptidoglycan-associated protein
MSQFKDAQPPMSVLVFSAAFIAWMVSYSVDAEAIGSQSPAKSLNAAPAAVWAPYEAPTLAPSAIVLQGKAAYSVEHNTTKIFFPPSRTALPLALDSVWPAIVQAAEQGGRIHIAGFHDTTGNARQNTALAKQRAHNVKQQLIALGVPSHAITVQKPAVATDTQDHAQARRVDVTLLR